MKNKYSLIYLLTIFAIALSLQPASSQSISKTLWTQTNSSQMRTAHRSWYPTHYETFKLQTETMRSMLLPAPMETDVASRFSTFIIELPMPDGSFNRYTLVESPVMDPALGAAYPSIKTYAGRGIDDRTATIRLDVTQFGFHAYVLSAGGTVYIDPLEFRNTEDYIVYYKHDVPGELYQFKCMLQTDEEQNELNNDHFRLYQPTAFIMSQPIGDTLRTYRLALAADGEYTTFFGGTVAGALAGMVTSMNRVNGVYERELCIHMNMVPNDTLLIYTNSATDPYTDSNGSTMLTQNKTTCNSVIGTANYDIGHVFSTGGGGIAQLGCVCGANKAEGVTGSPSPTGDAYDIDYVVHEMGHQFGANHTFNATTGSCGGGNRAASAAYEPGSASTIMGYAGICSPNDLQTHSDPYFHTKSFDEIVAFSQSGGSGNTCAVRTVTGNHPPVLTMPNASFTIPEKTPFKLTASATDPDNDSVTFCWEEYDLGPAGNWNAPVGNAPIFRSFNPTGSGSRLFPKLNNILNPAIVTIGEIKAAYNRSLTFRCTARDNRSGGGGVTHSPSVITLTVDSTGIPFSITYPNVSGISWAALDIDTVKWNVGLTDVAPINTPLVNIYLSTNNGQTFPIVLGTNVPNTGSYGFTVPNNQTTTARIWVEGAGNVFFDINDKAFSITAPVGIHETIFNNAVHLYPNPVIDEMHLVVSGTSTGACVITVKDIAGRTVREISLEKNQSVLEHSFDLSGIAQGMYIVRIELPEGALEKKLVKN